jgi:hypothetical protein
MLHRADTLGNTTDAEKYIKKLNKLDDLDDNELDADVNAEDVDDDNAEDDEAISSHTSSIVI